MKTKFIGNFLFVLCAAALLTVAYSCKSDDVITTVLPDANTISGTVTFADSNFIATGGTYLISAYASWPPMGPPATYDTIKINRNSSTGKWNQAYDYKLKGLNNGDYAIAVGFRKATGGQSPIMGIFGCDTTHNTCVLTTTMRAGIVNNAGVTGINFTSWADTTKKLY